MYNSRIHDFIIYPLFNEFEKKETKITKRNDFNIYISHIYTEKNYIRGEMRVKG